jgi:hypothetical protein
VELSVSFSSLPLPFRPNGGDFISYGDLELMMQNEIVETLGYLGQILMHHDPFDSVRIKDYLAHSKEA